MPSMVSGKFCFGICRQCLSVREVSQTLACLGVAAVAKDTGLGEASRCHLGKEWYTFVNG